MAWTHAAAQERRDDQALQAVAEPAIRISRLTAFTRARARLPLVSETAGRVTAVYRDIGDGIGDDGVFALIDDTFIRLELDETAVRRERLEARIAYEEREVTRYRELARTNNTAASELDRVEQNLRDHRLELRELEVQQRTLQERLRRTRVTAPPGWHVTERRVEPGQWVGAGERVGEVADFKNLILPFALTPEQYAALDAFASSPPGLRVRLPDLERDVQVSVFRSNPGFDAETRKIAVDLRIDGPLDPARGGLRAELALPLPEENGAVLLPAAALRSSYEEHWVDPVDGAPIRVLLLQRNAGRDGSMVRVSSPDIAPGDRFRLQGAGRAP